MPIIIIAILIIIGIFYFSNQALKNFKEELKAEMEETIKKEIRKEIKNYMYNSNTFYNDYDEKEK